MWTTSHLCTSLNLIVFIDALSCRKEIPAEMNQMQSANMAAFIRAKPDRLDVKVPLDHSQIDFT